MSEIRATTISDQLGTGPVTLTGQSAAKAWSNLDGTGTINANDDFNVSGYVDNGTGDYTITIANDMSDANYQVSSASTQSSATSTLTGVCINSSTPPTAGALQIYASYVNSTTDRTNYDYTNNYLSVLGDLA